MNDSLTDKTCLITGASSGIGFHTALKLAETGATIVMTSNEEILETAVSRIITETGNTHVIALPCDLSDQASIRKMAGEFLSNFNRLDILINNAGVFRSSRQVTPEGYEYTFAVNLLAPFLLTRLLLPSMLDSAPARIINLVSSFHLMGRIDPGNLHFEKRRYDGLMAYNNSKLANVMFTYELSSRLEGTGITVNACDPWGTRTNICKGQKGFYRLLWWLIWPVIQPVSKGAETSVYLSISEDVDGISGKYFRHMRQMRSSVRSHDPVITARLWSECERLTGVSYDELLKSPET